MLTVPYGGNEQGSGMTRFRKLLMVMILAPVCVFTDDNIMTKAETASQPAFIGPPAPKAPPTTDQICQLIEKSAETYGIPKDFFARLIWKESRFDHRAVSPVGAEGIAQFMPYTARERGLADPFDVEQAIPASASFLADLKKAFGNWGLAAAAYNAGAGRVSNWMRSGGFLPLETEDYVFDITGSPADDFSTGKELVNRPLDAKLAFSEA